MEGSEVGPSGVRESKEREEGRWGRRDINTLGSGYSWACEDAWIDLEALIMT